MNVADAMTPRETLVTVSVPGTRDDALEYLQERHFSSVPVVKGEGDDEEFRGLVTRQALIEHPDEDQLALLAEEGPTITADATIEEAALLMAETGARRVPVVDGEAQGAAESSGQLEGIVTITDVVRTMAEGEVAGETQVGELASRTVNAVYAETPLPVAERELSHSGAPYAVVLDAEGEMCGVLTEVDILDVARVVEGEDETGDAIASPEADWKWEDIQAVDGGYVTTRNVEIPDEPVTEFMTSDVVSVGTTRTAREAAQEMIRNDIEQIPLVSGGELVGVVRDIDLLEAVNE